MDSVLDIALRHARENDATRIHRIVLRIGELAGVSMDALEFAFDILTRDTPAEGAELVVEHVRATCACQECGTTYEANEPVSGCPQCGSYRGKLVQGREMELVSMEVS